MKIKKFSIVLLSTFLFPALIQAETLLSFKPPKVGAPSTRIGGGTRGSNLAMIDLQTLAPAQTALTSQASPTLYWYISDTSPSPVEITLNLEKEGEPIVEKTLPPIIKAGIQAINLEELNVELEIGKEYRWSVALVANSEQHSGDIFTSATIRRETSSIALKNTAELAAAGFWYDVLPQLVEQKSPQLNEFLKQGGITLTPKTHEY
jgi:hypothetical protein